MMIIKVIKQDNNYNLHSLLYTRNFKSTLHINHHDLVDLTTKYYFSE